MASSKPARPDEQASLPAPAIPPFRRIQSVTHVFPTDKARAAAEEHMALPDSPTERELDPKRVKELLDRIKGGRMLPFNWATVTYGGKKYRMNGHHSSQAIIEAGESLPSEVVVHLDHFEAPDAESMGVLFRQFDARFSGRSKQDVAGAYQGLIPELASCNKRRAKLAIEGLCWYERAIERLPVPSNDDIYQRFLNKGVHGFIRWVNHILSLKTPELERAPILGAMYAIFIASESGAQEFWSHVAKGDLTDDTDPRSVLSQELVRIKEDKSKMAPVAPAEFYAKCIKAWNAFRAGEKIRSLNVNTKKGLPEIAA